VFETPFGSNNPICFAIWLFINLLPRVCFYWGGKNKKKKKVSVLPQGIEHISNLVLKKHTGESTQVVGRGALNSTWISTLLHF